MKKILKTILLFLKNNLVIEDYSDLSDEMTESTLWRNYHQNFMGRISY